MAWSCPRDRAGGPEDRHATRDLDAGCEADRDPLIDTDPRGRGIALAGSLPVPDDPFFDDPARVTAALRHLDAVITDR